MHVPRSPKRQLGRVRAAAATVAVLGLLLTLLPNALAASNPQASEPAAVKPTIVLVHGAFADAAGWAGVTKRLQAKGYTVYAPANELRSLKDDSEYIRAFLDTIPGNIVLVGHSYGGAVITNAATGDAAVKALVYINAYALDEGETVADASALGGGSSQLGEHLVVRPYPHAPEGDGDAYIDPAFYRHLFAQDVAPAKAAAMAASQRPAALQVFGTPSGVPAWKTIPSWYLVSSHDRVLPPEAERFMAGRAGSHTVEIASSHVAMISHPDDVTDLILAAATSH